MKRIPLTGKHGEGKFAIVDDEDYPILMRMTWCLAEHGYPKTRDFYMHQLILGFPETNGGILIDHKDRNPLNMRKDNLRVTTRQRNLFNRPKQKNNQGLYKGVFFRERLKAKPWQASIAKTENGVQRSYFLGYFATSEEAARAYNKKARELFGEFAYLNQIRKVA